MIELYSRCLLKGLRLLLHEQWALNSAKSETHCKCTERYGERAIMRSRLNSHIPFDIFFFCRLIIIIRLFGNTFRVERATESNKLYSLLFGVWVCYIYVYKSMTHGDFRSFDGRFVWIRHVTVNVCFTCAVNVIAYYTVSGFCFTCLRLSLFGVSNTYMCICIYRTIFVWYN